MADQPNPDDLVLFFHIIFLFLFIYLIAIAKHYVTSFMRPCKSRDINRFSYNLYYYVFALNYSWFFYENANSLSDLKV